MELSPLSRHARTAIRGVGVGQKLFQAMTFAERAFAVDSGLQVLLMKPLQLASFLKTYV